MINYVVLGDPIWLDYNQKAREKIFLYTLILESNISYYTTYFVTTWGEETT